MAETSMLWAGNSGNGDPGDCGPYGEAQFADFLFYSLFGGHNGVLDGLAVVASSPNAKSVDVLVGAATIQGYFYRLDANTTLTIADNISGNDRIDRVVLRCDWTSLEIRLAVLEGTPSGSPSIPSVTQTPGTLYELPLAWIYVTNGFVAIYEAAINRERDWARQYPPGTFRPSLLETVPTGWIVCDGTAISRESYRDLFDAIGTTFGVGDGSTTFNVPDLRGRVFAGQDDMGGTSADVITDANADDMGGTMGEETHTLTVAELPAHDHDLPLAWTTTNVTSGASVAGSGAAITSDPTGGDQAHNNVQPTLFGNWIIKT